MWMTWNLYQVIHEGCTGKDEEVGTKDNRHQTEC